MPKEIYICELCQKEYDTEIEALRCEETHQKAVSVAKTGQRFSSLDMDVLYPTFVTLVMNDGKKENYIKTAMLKELCKGVIDEKTINR